MIPMVSDRKEMAVRLTLIRARLSRIAPDRWTAEIDETGERIAVARAVSEGGRVIGHEAAETMLIFDEGATLDERELVRGLHDDFAFLLSLIDRSFNEVRALRREAIKKDFAAEAAMKCGTAAFQKFLGAESGEVAAIRLKARLGIESRSELNTDADAARRWRELRAEFDAWRRAK